MVKKVVKEEEITDYKEPKKAKKSKKTENDSLKIEETNNIITKLVEEQEENKIDELIMENDDFLSHNNEEKSKTTTAKKRGRKPKGGKIVQQITPFSETKENKPNIILHLKCSLKDVQNDIFSNTANTIESFHFSSGKNDLNYEVICNDNSLLQKHLIVNEIESPQHNHHSNLIDELYNDEEPMNKETETKQIWKKLKQLEYNLHINNISDKKSACFWCTVDFDNPPIYIPKHFIKNSYQVYGCFCSPECATAFLMEENIDSSAKFERYQLLNHIYSKIYDYNKNIKPAPNPYYMLEKYYGNLTIQEYRSLLRNERLFLIVDKPLTRILPELHEDNDDFIINHKIIPSNAVPMKGHLRKKLQTKNHIVNEKFGLNP